MKRTMWKWLAAVMILLVMGSTVLWIVKMNMKDRIVSIEKPVTDASASDTNIHWPGEQEEPQNLVAVTTQNVQRVIRMLNRPAVYYAQAETVVYAGEKSRMFRVYYWKLAEEIITRRIDSLTGLVTCTICDNENVTSWQEGGEVHQGAAGLYTIDTLTGIPTYESVLRLDNSLITEADYRDYNGEACIYIRTFDELLAYSETYYISLDSGLLLCSETYTQGEKVYSMELLNWSPDTTGSEEILPPAEES